MKKFVAAAFALLMVAGCGKSFSSLCEASVMTKEGPVCEAPANG